MKRIGLYGGTFDPIHNGHLNLAISLKEIHHLDQVWFCPASVNPLKQDRKIGHAHDRIKMIELAIEELPFLSILKDEIERAGISYTVDTIELLIKKFPDDQFSLILGEDALSTFLQWMKPEKIVELVPILVGARSCEPLSLEQRQIAPNIYNALLNGFTKIPMMDISSTEIRERLKNKLYCGHLLPSKVLDYIYINHLYL